MSVYEYPQYCLLRQLLLWVQQSYPPAVQIFCSRGTANQKEAGLKGKGGKKVSGGHAKAYYEMNKDYFKLWVFLSQLFFYI